MAFSVGAPVRANKWVFGCQDGILRHHIRTLNH